MKDIFGDTGFDNKLSVGLYRSPCYLVIKALIYSFFVFIIMLGLNAHAHESILIAEAHKPFTENRIAEAIEMFKIAISSSNPQKECKIMGLGSIKHQRGYYQHDISRWYFQEIVGKGDNNPYDGLSLCFSITRDYQAATQYYLSMATKYPDNHCLKFGLANAYNNQGKVSQATGLYEMILTQSKYNQGECLRELVLLSFAGQDFDACRAYLAQMKPFPKEVQVQAIQAYLINDTRQKIAKMQQLINKYPSYTRLRMFIAHIYEKECQDIQKAIEIYENCIDQGEKNRDYWEEPYFCLCRLYRKTYKYDQSISVIKRLTEKVGDNWLAYLFLAEDHLKLSKGHESLHFLKNCLSQISKDDWIYLSEENRIYLMKSISQHIRDMQKYLIYNKLTQQISLTDGLYSIFQADININTTKLRMNNSHLLAFLKETSEQPRQPSILQHIYRLFCENESNLQLLDLYCSNLIVEAIKKHPMSLQTISAEIQNILTIKIVEEKIEVFSQIDPNHGKYEYKLKVKSKIVDAFASKEIATYFSKYSHLFMVIKKIALKVKDIKPWLQLLVQKVKLNPKLLVFNEHIALKVDGKNQWICINEVIQELLPQTSQQNQQLLKEVQRSFATSFHKTLPEFTKILIKKWQDVVTRVLDNRRAERKEIRCEISDWAVVQLVFPSQMRLIQSLQDIKHWCEQSGAVIVGVEGHLDRDKELRLKVVIKEICCMIKLKVNYKLKLKQFQQAIRIIIGNQRNAIFNSLLNLNKHYQYSLLSQIKEMSHYFQHSRNPAAQQIQRSIAKFVGGIECIDNWQQFSRHEKLKLSESWMSPTKIKRHEQRLLTEAHDRFPSAHQIKTEVSVQTEQLKPHEIMQQYQPTNSLLRTTSQNNINFIEQYNQIGSNQHTPVSKRSMYLQPSQSSNIYLSQEQNGKASFEELPQISKSKKCLQRFGIKYSHSETQSEHELQDMQVNGHKEPLPDINQEISRQNQQLKGHIEALFKHNAQLTANYSQKLSEKETELIQLDKELQRRVQRQIQLLSTIEEMKGQHNRDKMEKEDRISKLHESMREKDQRMNEFETIIRNSDESNRQIVSDANKRMVALQKQLEVAQSQSGRLKAENQSLKSQLAEHNKQICDMTRGSHEQFSIETISQQIYEQLQTKMKNIHIENLQLQVKLREAIHQKELRVSDLTRELEGTRAKIGQHIKTERQLREEISILKAENEQLRRRAIQIPPPFNDTKEQTSQTVTQQRELQEIQTSSLREMVAKMKSEIVILKTQLQKSSKREKCPCWDRRASNKRRQYLVILFTILLFEAITVSFTLNLFK